MILGLPGAGKTASLRNLPPEHTAVISGEPQQLRTLMNFGWTRAKVLTPFTPAEWPPAIDKAAADPGIKHVVVDTITSCHDLFLEAYIADKRKEGTEVDKLGLDMYRVANLKFQEVCRKLFKLPQKGINLILCCHLKYRTDQNNRQMQEPALSDNLTTWIARQCSIILRAERTTLGRETKYYLKKRGASGDFGSDKTGTVEDVEPNDIARILKRVEEATPPLEESEPQAVQHEEKEEKKMTFENTRAPERTRKGAYQKFMKLVADAPTCTPDEARKWITDQTGKPYSQVNASQFKTLEKKFKEQFIPPFCEKEQS